MAKEKQLRILEVLDNYFPTIEGPVNLIDNYCRELNKRTECCDALVPWYPNSKDGGGYKVIRCLSMSGGKYGVRLPLPAFDLGLKKHLKDNHYDIIHCHSPVTLARFVEGIAKKQHIPVVLTIHTKYHEEINRSVKTPFLQRFALRFLLKGIRNADFLWSASDSGKEFCRDIYKIDKPCEVVYNGTDMHPLEERRAAQLIDEINARHNLDKDETVLLFVGRLVVVKNIPLIIKTVKCLKERGEKCKFLIVGDGDYKKNLETLVNNLGLTENVIFAGAIKDRERLAAYYKRAKLLVFPSTFDTDSLVKREAASQGTPTVAGASSSCAETMRDNHNGYLADGFEPDSWADRIQEILKDDEAYLRVAETCYKEIGKHWSALMDDILEKYEACIREYKNKI